MFNVGHDDEDDYKQNIEFICEKKQNKQILENEK